MKVCLLKNDYISSIELPNKIQGQYWLKDESSTDKNNIIAIEGNGENWIIKANKKIKFEDNKERVALNKNVIYRLKDEEGKAIFIYVETEYSNTYFLKYKINFKEGVITLGRSQDNTIQVENPGISSHHFRLIYRDTQWRVIDNSSTNGTFVNNRKMTEMPLKVGDVVYALGTKIIIGINFISINKNDLIKINDHDLKLMNFEKYISDDDYEIDPINYFYRSPRIKRDIQTKKIIIDNPPDNQIGDEMPMMMVIGPSITMGMASLSTGIFAIANAMSTGNISSAAPSIVMSLSMLLGTVMWPIITKRYERKRKREKEQKRQEKYGRYLDHKEKEIADCANEQNVIWNENFPTIENCVQKIINQDDTLFQRNAKQNDFLELRLGLGKRRVDIEIQYSKKTFSLVEDNLKDRLNTICESEKIIDNVPVTISLLKHDFLGIVGSHDIRYRLLKNLLVQIFAFYSYEDIKTVFLYNENDIQYDYLKWLPYTFDNKKENRYIARNMAELKDLSTFLESVISVRENLNEEEMTDQIPYYLIFVLDNDLIKKAGFIKRLVKQKQNMRFSIIQLCDELKDLSNDCKTVVNVQGRNGSYYDLTDMTGNKTYFIPDYNDIDLDLISHKLSNIQLDISEDNTNLPEMISFLQMYNVGKIEHLNALTRWKENDPTKSLEAPVGVDNLGELFNLDLHQKYHGPHGLVAGMTGSGKSEFIMTYILSLAINYHPYEVAFILIDYKGGGMAKAFENLPHTAGIITNLDGASVKRSLISIESELKRRQSIFAQTSERLNMSNMDIYKYQGLYRQNLVDEPLQHLFIISDEFAELKTQQPEFMEQLVSAARIGRSLGVHLILATQKPSGVVDDQIWSNSRFRICLKVQERSDSMDMLKRPDAAEISQTGRFYLQVGYNELFEMGQSAWAGAPYYPSDRPIVEKNDSVDMIGMNGHIIQSMKFDYRKLKYPKAKKQLDEITHYLRKIADDEKIQIKPLWLDPIPEIIYIDELIEKYSLNNSNHHYLNPVIGEYDDPSTQSQSILTLPITEGGNTVIYGIPNSGKTTLLSAILYSLICNYTAKEVNIYVLDFAAETLKAFEKAPQVGDVLLSYQEEKITNLFRMLKKEIDKRKKLFSNFGGDIISYNTENSDCMHSIVVMINNYSAFCELYEEREDAVAYLSREGMKYGIYFIITSTTTTGIKYRLLQNFSQSITLQMNDDTDYVSILGKTDGLYPMRYKGRGLVKIKDSIYEFQTAYASKNLQMFNDIDDFCQQVRIISEDRAYSVPILPDYVSIDFIQPYIKNESMQIPVGIEELSLEPSYFEFNKDYLNFIISNNDESTDLIQSIISIQNGVQSTNVFVFDPKNIITSSQQYRLFKGTNDITQGIHQLFEIVLKRNNLYKESAHVDEVVAMFEEIFVVITSIDDLLGAYDDKTNEMLELILEKGKSVYKINILIASTAKNIGSLSYSRWFKENANSQNVIWYGSGLADQYIFDLNNKGSDLCVQLPNMFGFVVQNGNYTKVKFITQKSENK